MRASAETETAKPEAAAAAPADGKDETYEVRGAAAAELRCMQRAATNRQGEERQLMRRRNRRCTSASRWASGSAAARTAWHTSPASTRRRAMSTTRCRSAWPIGGNSRMLLSEGPPNAAAETSRSGWQVGDKLVELSASFGDDVWPAGNYGQTMYAIKTRNGQLYFKIKKMYGDLSAFEVPSPRDPGRPDGMRGRSQQGLGACCGESPT